MSVGSERPDKRRIRWQRENYVPPPFPEVPRPAPQRRDGEQLGHFSVDRQEIPPLLRPSPSLQKQGKVDTGRMPKSTMEDNTHAAREGAWDRTTKATQMHDYYTGHPSMPRSQVQANLDAVGYAFFGMVLLGFVILASKK